jgi:3-hydroxyacyl-CoA dehydrogenase/enoyl-CoA hydratase/3-hydroxybutyryl-CoA epimerase
MNLTNITRTSAPGNIAVLTFDRVDSSANIFDWPTLTELNNHLGAIEAESDVKGVVIGSAKPKIFIAGADLHAFASNPEAAALAEIVTLGQDIFTRLSNLRVPTVAAIHGLCLGGGLELALACDWRIASTEKTTKLGLPETQLGILPAWGGSTRLPKLIGLPAALGLILTGKQVVGVQALKLGLVDELAHLEYLVETALRMIPKGKRPAPRITWLSRPPLAGTVVAKARRDVLAKTHGRYPAPLKALEVCRSAVLAPVAEGLALEKAAFLELVRSPESRALMSIFFLQERAKKLTGANTEGTARAVSNTAVIGAGTMGAGIAQWLSARGLSVCLKDVEPAALARGLHAIEKIYADAVKHRVFTATEAVAGLDRVSPVHVDVPLKDVDLVIEAAVEKLELKQAIFRELEPRVGSQTILATNTSALSIDAIASALDQPDRLVGIHFFNPVHKMQLVEIVRGPRTSAVALDTALQFVKAIGKLPLIAKDSPGFLVNRVLLPYMVEAVRLFSEGVSVSEIDALLLDFGMPMGPLRLCDEVGLDVAQHVAKDLEQRLKQSVPITDTLEQMIKKAWLGKKSGRGFYLHDGKKKKGDHARPNPEVVAFQKAGVGLTQDAATRLDRLVLIQINEAARVLEEGVVESPEDVDFGMILGTGWAPFRGGPLRYADSLGAPEIVRRLDLLAEKGAPYFAPCERLREMAHHERGFYDALPPKPTAVDRLAKLSQLRQSLLSS